MEIIGDDDLRRDAAKHGDTKRVIENWINVVKGANWKSIDDVKKAYPSTDYVKGATVFNIKGNS